MPRSKKPAAPPSELATAFEERPAGHLHSFGLIRTFVVMVRSAIGYRAAARAIEIVAPLLPGGSGCSANGGQLWLLRLGLYELLRPKEQAEDWVWMIDHTIQTGDGKCFAVVGVRWSAWQEKREAALAADPASSFALAHEDLSVFAIEHMASSTGEAVHQQLERLVAETGITPCCILSDQGADVRGAGERFRQSGDRATVLVYDIAHAVANALKRQLNKNPQWEAFLADANRCKTAIRQTPYAFLMPPELKNKARWMNLDALIGWSCRVREFLHDPRAALSRAQAPADLETLEQKMGWLRRHEESIARWSAMMEAAAITLKYVRNQGYHEGAHRELSSLLTAFREGPAEAMVTEVLEFVRVQCERCGTRRLPGSTEVLESLIGKGKQLMGRNRNGYTKTVLAMATATTKITTDTIRAALDQVKVKDLRQWVRKKLGISLQSQRQRALPTLACGTKLG